MDELSDGDVQFQNYFQIPTSTPKEKDREIVPRLNFGQDNTMKSKTNYGAFGLPFSSFAK